MANAGLAELLRENGKGADVTARAKAKPGKKSGDATPLVSVIIPVKNGLPHFRNVVEMLKEQKLEKSYEVIIIDSGSTDGSLEVVPANDKRFRLVKINSSEFGHGRTRNYGASLSKAKYCAFLTHDALPVDENWLSEIIKPMEEDDEVAGVFGRHIAYESDGPFVRWELETHFSGLKNWETVQIKDAREYARNQGIRQVYHFYSDNSSCLRRSVWEEFPYPDVEFAEDQIWAKRIVEAGFKKAFAWNSVVYHSHNYGIWERMQRSFDEALALNGLFGYELCPSMKQLFLQTVKTTGRDLKLAITNGWILKHPVYSFLKPFDNLARQIGYYLGTAKPAFVVGRAKTFSRDRKLRES